MAHKGSVKPTGKPLSAQGLGAQGEMRQHGVRGFGADDPHQLLAGRPAHAGQAAKGRQQRLAPARPDPRDLVELGPQIRLVREARWNVTANRCASSRMRRISSRAGLSSRSAIGSSRSRMNSSSSFLAMPTATSLPSPRLSSARTPPTTAPCRRRSGSGRETARRSRAACVAADDDLAHRGEVVQDSRFGFARARGFGVVRGPSGATAL